MATATNAVQGIYSDLLGRSAGSSGLDYWSKEWEATKAAAIAGGKTTAAAEAEATAGIRSNVGLSSEAFEYVSGTSDKATTAYDAEAAGIPDWFEFQDTNYKIDGPRAGDWAGNVKTENLENYMTDINDLYGITQGNVVGQEGVDWWGYQMTQNIQSGLAAGQDFQTAYSNAKQTVERDIKKGSGHANYEKYGSIGYGNAIETITGYESDGDPIIEKQYLNLSQKAIDEFGILDHTGTKTAQHHQMIQATNEDGTLKYDSDGDPVYNKGAQTDTSSLPFRWNMVPDARFPGGYRIDKVPFNTITGQSDTVGTTKAQNFIAYNYMNDKGQPTFTDGGLLIPPDIVNVDASEFAAGNMDYATWAETPIGKASIAAGNYHDKNQGMHVNPDGSLSPYRTPDYNAYDYNLGLGIGENVELDLGDGWYTTFEGPPYYGPGGGGYAKPKPKENNAMMMGGGSTNVYIDMGQKSKTAKDQQMKDDARGIAAAPNRKTYQKKSKTSPNVSSLGIPATTTSARYSVPGAT